MEAKKQGAGEEDLSMEEILQSIRRIIADDSEEGKAPAVASEEKSTDASDILELTDMLEEDGSITNLKEAKAAPAVDVLSNIDAALAPEPVAPPPPVEPPAPSPAKAEPEMKAAESKPMSQDELDALLSKAAEDAAVSSLAKLKVPEEAPVYRATTPSPEFRSGNTVEDMVEEMIRPMLKDWLDTNLPIIVERIVEREVTRLSRR